MKTANYIVAVGEFLADIRDMPVEILSGANPIFIHGEYQLFPMVGLSVVQYSEDSSLDHRELRLSTWGTATHDDSFLLREPLNPVRRSLAVSFSAPFPTFLIIFGTLVTWSLNYL